MLERTLNLKIDEAYTKIETKLVEKGCKILFKDPPNRISFRQGSLWGLTPKTAKKTIDLVLGIHENDTRIKCLSKLSSDWKNITLVGCVFAFVLVVICVWMATDLTGVLATGQKSFWSWIVTIGGRVNSEVGTIFVNIVRGLAVFLLAVIGLETVIVFYAAAKIDAFVTEILDILR